MMRWFFSVCAALSACLLASAPANAQVGAGASAQTLASRGMFPFALPPFDGAPGPTDVSFLNDGAAGKDGFVRVQGENFVDGRGRKLRFWGVNLNFNGVFPDKTDAPGIAARLAKFGFNAVRLHHFEGQANPLGIWKGKSYNVSRPVEFDPEQVEKLDFFVAELVKRGIYIDFNLHVARKVSDADGFAGAARFPEKDKGIAYFDPKLGALNQQFARDLLTHVNPYLGRAYKDEPGICAFEVDNENSILSLWLEDKLGGLPPTTLAQLRDGWNDWLRAKYSSQASLARAYTENNTDPSGPELLLPANYAAPTAPVIAAPTGVDQFIGADGTVLPILPDGTSMAATPPAPTLNVWKLNLAGGGAGHLSRDNMGGPAINGIVQPGLNAQLNVPGNVTWAFQMVRDGLQLESGRVYTFSFWARANSPRALSVNLWEDKPPYRFLGLSQSLKLSTDWQQFVVGFKPQGATPGSVRLSMNLGNATGAVQFGEMSLRAGGRIAAPSDWSLRAGLPIIDANSEPIFAARRDFAQYLGGLELAYLNQMRDFLKKDLGVRVPIWHTQAQFGGWAGLARESASDAIDVHIYWKHPNFGTTGWNGGNWTVEQQSLAANPLGDPLATYAMLRVPGKPFVVSEFNSGQPNDYGAESLLMAATTAAHQGWAGVWVFDYHGAGAWDRNSFEGFFSIDSHPLKMATAPAAALIFRRGDATEATSQTTLFLPREQEWSEVANTPAVPSMGPYLKTWNAAGAPPVAAFTGKVGTVRNTGVFPAPSLAGLDNPGRWISDTGQITRNGRAGWFKLNAPRAKAWAGPSSGQQLVTGELSALFPSSSSVPWSTGALVSMDGLPLDSSRRMLLISAGKAENIGMGWNPNRTSVGQNWGSGPTYVSAPEARWRLLTSAPFLRVYALDERGQRQNLVPSTLKAGALKFGTSNTDQTVWYEIVGE